MILPFSKRFIDVRSQMDSFSLNLCICMFAVAGKMAEPNWLRFFEETQGYHGGNTARREILYTGNAGHFS